MDTDGVTGVDADCLVTGETSTSIGKDKRSELVRRSKQMWRQMLKVLWEKACKDSRIKGNGNWIVAFSFSGLTELDTGEE